MILTVSQLVIVTGVIAIIVIAGLTLAFALRRYHMSRRLKNLDKIIEAGKDRRRFP